MEIVMARGDLETRTFQIVDADGEPYTEQMNDIYMTVKKTPKERSVIFQKRISNGTISYLGDGMYQFVIEPHDTDGLAFGDYVFDIELIKQDEIKKTFCGLLKLMPEVTHAVNEMIT